MTATANLGYPRIGPERALKRLTEAYWAGRIDGDELRAGAARLRIDRWREQQAAGIDQIPSNDFSLYDHVLDTAVLVGAVPGRYGAVGEEAELDAYFAMARGVQRVGRDLPALGMTKWFDTNYHYIVPELDSGSAFRLAGSKPFAEFQEALALGIHTRPVLLGPVSFLLLARCADPKGDRLERLLDALVDVYGEILGRLASLGAEWIQLDEPCLVQERTPSELAALEHAYGRLAAAAGSARIMLQTYFGHVDGAYDTLVGLPIGGLGLDFARGARNLELIRERGFPAGMTLSAGVVDGRNIWVNDLGASLTLLEELSAEVGPERLMVAPSCSLLHVPLDVKRESALDAELRCWLAFARQKLDETVILARGLDGGRAAVAAELEANREVLRARAASPRTRAPAVRERVASPREDRRAPWPERERSQRARLGLPVLPTTTVGSFPQDASVRGARRDVRQGALAPSAYEAFLRGQVERAIRVQEEAGVDVPTHGEFERGDMVEHFAERLEGYASTAHGWVQSYGTRYVKPPILYGDIRRPAAMTVEWWRYAQSLTARPVKGMLTGPVTMLQWSFVRDDQPRRDTCLQLALAVRDEVLDLEAAGAAVIQVDEPALREGLPLRRAEREAYLAWAAAGFRTATGGVRAETQIHTHMCYSSFGEIIAAIAAMDADVLLIESARSSAALLAVFRTHAYPRAIGPGVYDIHSPRVPGEEEMAERIRASLRVLHPDQLWITPDCGLKTRAWDEAEPALRAMVAAARSVRQQLGRTLESSGPPEVAASPSAAVGVALEEIESEMYAGY